ncbi:MAG TPA: pitrilysin family protein [Thermoanaerobaculia bacterium]|nr:pitrilysin family protein [Thermoanaerobaculia bacterium]
MNPRIGLALCLAMAATGVAAVARAAGTAPSGDIFPYPIQQKTLPNGLKMIVVPFDSPGIVAYYTVVRTGSRDEVEPGKTGFAHFFEHMMFRGTDKYPRDKYNELLKRMGADSNASTDDDLTLYHIVGPKRELETMMDMESDRFKNLKYSEPAFRTEALAVLGEYNKSVSSPVLPMFEKLQDLSFTRHTYKHTTLGFLADIRAMPEQYAWSRLFFERFYRPENCVLLIVGDVEPAPTFALAERYYGDWKTGYKPAEIPVEPPQSEPKSARLSWPNPVHPYLLYGYRAPAFSTTTADWAALDLIGQVLFSESAPLYQELVVDKQWVDRISGGLPARRDPFVFTILARARSEELLPQVQKSIADAIAKLQAEPVDPARLERIKSYLRYSFAAELDSPSEAAEQLAQMIALTGRVETLNELYQRYAQVTPADVQRVARAVFVPSQQTVITLVHDAPSASPPAGSPGGGNRP